MLQRTFLSSVSLLALLLGSATPVAAYIFGGAGLGPDDSLPPDYAGSIIHHDRILTSRDVVKSAAFNAPLAGEILPYGLERGASDEGYTGRFLLPTRSFARWDLIDNARRHRLGRNRGGDWRILNVAGNLHSSDDLSFGNTLPPSLVVTGGDDDVAYDRPTRRDIRDNGMFAVRHRDRNLLREMQESSR